MTQAQAQRVIGRMVDLIVKRFDPEKVILFGSRARGDARPDSDVDLIVVMSSWEGKRHDKCVEIRVALHDVRVAKDIFIITPKELELHRNIPGTLGRAAYRHGKVLYERLHPEKERRHGDLSIKLCR